MNKITPKPPPYDWIDLALALESEFHTLAVERRLQFCCSESIKEALAEF